MLKKPVGYLSQEYLGLPLYVLQSIFGNLVPYNDIISGKISVSSFIKENIYPYLNLTQRSIADPKRNSYTVFFKVILTHTNPALSMLFLFL